ncbi:nuclear transport factor 2 family protein [Paractinoplanes lichenicola]|uniref:Nuclear transport factor 2 family protein n=1 Tax=Paractinoplanes lichenicola TaxID=2802976 RepID=A0ABS1VWM6_9ACTN|nr:nuclear transport factor 2 family protein [Actinoplanes lichenicola]MBL7258890.1 nuclear transport factor 2 family protein [Actinoplanes lichenicola]
MDLKLVVAEWHASVNSADPHRAAQAVTDPVLVLGPRGTAEISPAQFAEWVERSGIRLEPREWHPIDDHVMVVEQDATWPESPTATRVATVFRVRGGKVAAALRCPDLATALEQATA